MLDKILDILQGLTGVVLAIMILIFGWMMIVGFVSLCLGAL